MKINENIAQLEVEVKEPISRAGPVRDSIIDEDPINVTSGPQMQLVYCDSSCREGNGRGTDGGIQRGVQHRDLRDPGQEKGTGDSPAAPITARIALHQSAV